MRSILTFLLVIVFNVISIKAQEEYFIKVTKKPVWKVVSDGMNEVLRFRIQDNGNSIIVYKNKGYKLIRTAENLTLKDTADDIELAYVLTKNRNKTLVIADGTEFTWNFKDGNSYTFSNNGQSASFLKSTKLTDTYKFQYTDTASNVKHKELLKMFALFHVAEKKTKVVKVPPAIIGLAIMVAILQIISNTNR
jgi:hypothetical protein